MAKWPSGGNVYPGTPKAYPVAPKAYPSTVNSYPGGAPVAGFTPPSSGLVLWLDSAQAYNTDTGNGTATTAMVDRSGNSSSVVEAGAGLGPLRRAANGRRPEYVQYSSGKWVDVINATLIALGNGAAKDKTIVLIGQPTLTGTSYKYSWGHTSLTTRYISERRENNTYKDQVVARDPTFNNNVGALQETGVNHLTPQVHALIWDATAGTFQYRTDGVSNTAQAISLGTNVIDRFVEGALATGAAPGLLSGMLRMHLLVYNRVLSLAELQSIETQAAPLLGKSGIGKSWASGYSTAAAFGNGSNAWLVVVVPAQSNGAGRGTTPGPTVAASDAIYCHYADGNMDVFTEPSADPTNAVGGMSVDSGAATSMFGRMALRLRELGETRNIMIVNTAIGSTDSPAWASNLTTNPPPINSPVGALKHRVMEALKAPNAELVTVIYQGESNTDVGGESASWPTNWGAILDELNTYFGAAYVKTKRHFVCNLPATAWTGAFAGEWAALRSLITTFCTVTRTDCTEIQMPSGPYTDGTFLHLETGSNTPASETGLMSAGILVANAIFAAT